MSGDACLQSGRQTTRSRMVGMPSARSPSRWESRSNRHCRHMRTSASSHPTSAWKCSQSLWIGKTLLHRRLSPEFPDFAIVAQGLAVQHRRRSIRFEWPPPSVGWYSGHRRRYDLASAFTGLGRDHAVRSLDVRRKSSSSPNVRGAGARTRRGA